jgi:hypothetical protein
MCGNDRSTGIDLPFGSLGYAALTHADKLGSELLDRKDTTELL